MDILSHTRVRPCAFSPHHKGFLPTPHGVSPHTTRGDVGLDHGVGHSRCCWAEAPAPHDRRAPVVADAGGPPQGPTGAETMIEAHHHGRTPAYGGQLTRRKGRPGGGPGSVSTSVKAIPKVV